MYVYMYVCMLVCLYGVCMYVQCMYVYMYACLSTAMLSSHNKVILLQNESIQVTRLQSVPLIIFSKGLAVDSKFE